MASGKILTIDDSEAIRIQLKNILEPADFVVLEAVDGAQGLDRLRQHRDIDLILCDINMPGMNGLEMLEAANKEGLIGTAPVFMLTTELVAQRVEEAKRARVTAWIIKPPNPKSLLLTISKVLDLEKNKSRGA